LQSLHSEADHQWLPFIPVYLGLMWDRLRGRKAGSREEATRLRKLFLPLSAEGGLFVYQVARSMGARHVVEFGTSFGVSTIYLAAAVRDNGGGTLVASEIEPGKVARARQHLIAAGLDDLVDIREGDALETLKGLSGPVDLLFLDGWKAQYLSILKLVRPLMHSGSVVLADDVYRFSKTLHSYVQHMRNSENGFTSLSINLGEGIEYSVLFR
jgi:predicted O-methyltransferase YrrM